MSFSSDINKFALKVESRSEKVFRGTVLGLFSSIIKRTPVDTGRLRGNWQLTINKPAYGELDVADKTGAKALATGTTNSKKIKLKDSVYLTNNMPYAGVIEDGRTDSSGSLQAPQGMVKVTVTEYQRIVSANAKKVNK